MSENDLKSQGSITDLSIYRANVDAGKNLKHRQRIITRYPNVFWIAQSQERKEERVTRASILLFLFSSF